jgi:DNA-binding NarL/FixJ family response regulator
MTMITVVIADDQALVRSGFRLILDSQPDISVVGEAADGIEAVTLCRELRPTVVLMDVQMPSLDGIDAARSLLADPEQPTRVLILTTFDADAYVYDAIRAGASGFMLKDVSALTLIEAVRTVAAGDAIVAPAITKRLLAAFTQAPMPHTDGVPPPFTALTDRELDVARLLAQGQANGEIARALFLGEATVKTHVTSILAKLGVRDRVQVVVAAYESGLVRPGAA